MVVVAFSTKTHEILYREGHTGPDHYRTAANTVFPGASVSVGTTLTKDCKLTADNLIFLGIAGLLPNHDIDTAYATGVTIPVYTKGCGAVVWAMFKTNIDAVASQPLIHGATAKTGMVTPGEGGTDEYAGIAYRDITVHGTSDEPGLIQLS